MKRWLNKTAVVTGASVGIGAACAQHLVKHGMNVVALARWSGKKSLDVLCKDLKEDERERLHGIKCDIRDEKKVIETFEQIVCEHGPISVLVNNAGVLRSTGLLKEDNSKDLQDIMETNVMGVAYCTREAFKSMKTEENGGHVFIINSVLGHVIPYVKDLSLSMYVPSKHTITVMLELYRQEFQRHSPKLRITGISPGVVDTAIINTDMKSQFKNLPMLRPKDIADALIYCLKVPPNVQIHDLIIKPVGDVF